ncbi:hypothetical protein FDP41_005976 [Naegleria fowleri]|uniref:Band 7 domain-containing protein n=1 Tax=Naegleria fowleri TaxID=5763 RepID=A0A6A5BB80_NAEFO|nr:uncharacterized protein FDP41_005976 [Naegleria fowleri]KAF0975223.1 hypothetical protein FDP41_005976 [Naegleria fowleri]
MLPKNNNNNSSFFSNPNLMQSTGDSSAENSDVNFYQPITIHEIIENLKKDRSVDASLYKKENTADIISDRLQSGTSIEALLVKPNVEGTNDALIHQILELVNDQQGLPVIRSVLGTTVVEPGKIRVVVVNGAIRLVGPGRYMNINPRGHWSSTYSIDSDRIEHETLKIVRVPKGYYGLASNNGQPLILGEGVHVRNSRLFNFVELKEINQEHIKHGTIDIMRIPQGKYGMVLENGIPKLLTAGYYVSDSVLFKYCGTVNINEPHIKHSTIQIIRIPKSSIGLIVVGTKPLLLHEGIYTFNDQNISFLGMKDANEQVIIHKPITRFRVKNGEIGLCWWQSKPLFIQDPGVYEVDSIDFVFEQCVPISSKLVALGSSMRIVVYDGEIGITYLKGKLDVLQPNTYIFHDSVLRTFEGYLSTKLNTIPLIEDGSKENFLRCDTKDLVELGIKASCSYRIGDPKLTLTTVGKEPQIIRLIKDQSIATVQAIVRSTALNQVAQSKTVNAGSQSSQSDKDGHPQQPTAPVFFEKIHDEFLSKLHDEFKKCYGIEITNIRIEDIQIMNQELANNISKQAIITAETETKLANLGGQREIDLAAQERSNAISSIKATAEAFKLRTETEAKNNAAILEAETKAMEIKTLAKARAEAMTIEAEAEARAIEIKALAEKKRAEYLSSTEFGKQDALLTKHHDMVVQAMKGIQQIVYLPSDANMGCLPLQMFGLKGGIPTFDSLMKEQPSTPTTIRK